MAALLGELRREMNGAVTESMQRGEGGYGLNYGVSIPTIRAIAGRVGTDHAFARFLYRQDVRELRMAAPTIADPASVTPDNVDEWFAGRMPEELIEELALRLLSRCGRPVLDTLCGRWLRAGSGAERYAALMALAQFRGIDVFEFFYASDNLDREQWDPRSLSTHAKLDEKDRAAYLALELARKITL